MDNPTALLSSTDQKIVWLASYPKSGNTWVRVFLHNLFRLRSNAGATPQDINRLMEQTTWELRPRDYDQILGKSALEAGTHEIAEARFQVQAKIAASRPGPFLVKTHNAIANVDGYPNINTDVTLAAVYIVRNPLDVAVSYAHHSAVSIDRIIEIMAEENFASPTTTKGVYEFLGPWSFHVASWLSIPHRPVYLVRYEDLLTNPLGTFTGLARFLRLDAAVETIQSAIHMSRFEELSKQEMAHDFIERPKVAERFFRNGTAGQWKKILTEKQINSVLTAHAPMMQRCGYVKADCGRNFLC